MKRTLKTQRTSWDPHRWRVCTRPLEQVTHQADLFPSKDDVDINTLLKANPKTKTEWQTLARQISTVLFQRLHAKPLYDEFAVEIAKQVATPLNDRDVRKIGTAMTVLSNEKQKEAKASVGGKKKVRQAEYPWKAIGLMLLNSFYRRRQSQYWVHRRTSPQSTQPMSLLGYHSLTFTASQG